MALMIGCIWHGLDALQGTRAKPGNHLVTNIRGFSKNCVSPKIRNYYGSGWVGPGLTRNLFLENRPKIALNQYWYFGVVLCIFCLYTLLKVVGYYDLSVLSMSVKKVWMGWVGGVSSTQMFWNFTLQSP